MLGSGCFLYCFASLGEGNLVYEETATLISVYLFPLLVLRQNAVIPMILSVEQKAQI